MNADQKEELHRGDAETSSQSEHHPSCCRFIQAKYSARISWSPCGSQRTASPWDYMFLLPGSRKLSTSAEGSQRIRRFVWAGTLRQHRVSGSISRRHMIWRLSKDESLAQIGREVRAGVWKRLFNPSPFTPWYSLITAKYRNFNGLAWSKVIFWDNLEAGKSV